jgi:hypothetical protein
VTATAGVALRHAFKVLVAAFFKVFVAYTIRLVTATAVHATNTLRGCY